jgi:hypothetical protein
MSSSQIPQLMFALGAALVLGLAFLIILRYGKRLREDLGLPDNSLKKVGAAARRPAAGSTGLTRDTYTMGRKLKAQGLPGPEALAAMSPAERQFFLDAVSARVGDGTGPRLVRGNAEAVPMHQASAPDAIPEAALVTGPIHCPVCRSEIGRRTDPGITMKKCPGCNRRVGARVEGDRLIVTVSYGLRS